MWPFSRKYSILESGILDGGTDWHCHILPGVDDGIRTAEEALEVLAFYEQIGIKEVWLTPHIMEDSPNGTAFLRKRFQDFQSIYNGSIKLHLAAENMMGQRPNSAGAEEINMTQESIGIVNEQYY